MTNLLDIFFRSSAVLAVALVACRLLTRRSAAVRHALLAGAIFIAGAVGPLGSVLPAWRLPVPIAASASPHAAVPPRVGPIDATVPVSNDAVRSNGASHGASIAWASRSIAAVWVIGLGVFFVRLRLSYARLNGLVRRARHIGDGRWTVAVRTAAFAAGVRRPVTILETDAAHVLATWGITRPHILVPTHARDWPMDRIHAVLSHEMAHVARGDWLVQSAADLVLVAFWFNPLAWLAARRLRVESERACDDAVLRQGIPAADYAAHLVAVARACRIPTSSSTTPLPVAGQTDLQTRIEAMLNSPSPSQALSRRSVALLVVSFVALAAPLSALRLAPAEPRALVGVVYDPTGAVVPGVKLALSGDGQAPREAVSNDTGRFDFGTVTPGHYVLEIAQPAFVRLKQSLELRRESDWERAIILQVGEVQETIIIRSPRLRSQSAAGTPARVRVGGKIRPPRKLRDVRPDYPAAMRAAGIEGTVGIEAIIGRDGTVQSTRVVSGLVHPDLAQAAADAVRQWKFDATTLNGAPVEVVMNVAVTFELEE